MGQHSVKVLESSGYSLSPATFLTKICIESSFSQTEEEEETDEMLLERMVARRAGIGKSK